MKCILMGVPKCGTTCEVVRKVNQETKSIAEREVLALPTTQQPQSILPKHESMDISILCFTTDIPTTKGGPKGKFLGTSDLSCSFSQPNSSKGQSTRHARLFQNWPLSMKIQQDHMLPSQNREKMRTKISCWICLRFISWQTSDYMLECNASVQNSNFQNQKQALTDNGENFAMETYGPIFRQHQVPLGHCVS